MKKLRRQISDLNSSIDLWQSFVDDEERRLKSFRTKLESLKKEKTKLEKELSKLEGADT